MEPIVVRGREIGLIEAGAPEKTPVVLLHCSASSKAQWRQLMEREAARYRFVAFDLWGYGETPNWPGHGPLALAYEADLLAAVAERIEGPFHAVGHSYGGATALKYALSHGDRLLSLTAIEPVAFFLLRHGDGRHSKLLEEISAFVPAIERRVIQGDYYGAMELFVDFWGGAGAWAAMTPEAKARIATSAAKIPLDFFALTQEPTPLTAFSGLSMPVHLIRGTASPDQTQAIVKLLLRTIPGARETAIEGAGHMSPLTHGEPVNAAIADFLAGVEAGQ